MSKKKGGVLNAAGVYTAVVLGAGFASGQEIIKFFVDYGKLGFLGILVSSALFAVTGWAVWDICFHHKIIRYKDFMDKVIGIKLGRLMEFVLGGFMFIVFSAMLAAAGAAINEAFRLPFTAGVYIAATLCFITFLFGMSGIVKLNSYLAPVMIIGCVFTGLYTYFFSGETVFANGAGVLGLLKQNWFVAAVVYASYNIITAVTVLASMHDIILSRKAAMLASIASGLLFVALGFSLALSLNLNYELTKNYEIPMLALVQRHGDMLEFTYIVIFLTAVFTTAATNGYAVIEWLHTRYGANELILSVSISLMGVIAASGGFSNLVSNVYPLFGIAGFIEILLILHYFIKNFRRK